MLACSSAGGGLRIAVVGNEELVTAEAGRRVALSSGGKVVLVLSGGLDDAELRRRCAAAEPDVVLLAGGTDGGNAEVLDAATPTSWRGARWTGPVVVAGNVEASDEVAALLDGARTPYVLADNVVPRIGVLAPESARARDPRDVPGPRDRRQAPQQPAPTSRRWSAARPPTSCSPASSCWPAASTTQHPGAGDVVVVDVGGATTDVHCVVELDPEDGGLAREVVATTPVTRTVEGDLGMRWSAVSTVEAAGRDDLRRGRRTPPRRTPASCPTTDAERDADEAIAAAAVGLALRRHAGRSQVVVSPEGRVVERSGKDLREVDLLVGSGGVLRHGGPDAYAGCCCPATGDAFEGGWQLPRAPVVVVTTTTCWPRPGCWPRSTPWRRTGWSTRLRTVGD